MQKILLRHIFLAHAILGMLVVNLIGGVYAAPPLSNSPLFLGGNISPNVMFTLDDSGSMHIPRFIEIKHVASIAMDMLHKALDSFARLDLNAAAQIVRQDEFVDEEFRSILRQLITFMMEDPRKISTCLEIVFVAKAIERIGDHAKNMSEYVVYMVKGKDVRHVTADEIEQEIRE